MLPTYVNRINIQFIMKVLRDADPVLFPRSTLAKEHGIELPTTNSTSTPIEQYTKNDTILTSTIPFSEMEAIRSYRITPEKLTKLKQILKSYQGTHNFHNYTNGKQFSEANAKRFIMSFEASDPKIIQETEWVSLKIHGQSFMLHQIRKMVGLAILMIRTNSPERITHQAFNATKKNIPKAPALGLLLDQTVYKSYNEKWASSDRQEIVFSHKQEEIDAFKEEWVYDKMIQTEVETNE